MSLITSCPACATMFRVVPDQLKISEGWVRCGHCAVIFDATAHLSDADAPVAADVPPEPAPQQAGTPAAAGSGSDEAIRGWEATAAAPLVSVPGALLPSRPDDQPAAAPRRTAAPAPGDSRVGPDSESLEPSALDSPFVFRRSDLMDHEALPSVLPPAPEDSRPAVDDEDDGREETPQLEQPSFVRKARGESVWQRPMARLALRLASLLLAAVLVLQLAYHDRDRLAAAQPALRPALEQMCVYLRCTLGYPRQIEAIMIDSSGFSRLRGESYRLTFNVRNTGATRIAAPALELTLTDSQDQPLLRRVLLPQELGGPAGFIAPGSEWSGAAGVDVSPTSAGRVAGYRLLAFYP
ncbi:MAG: hypothetical protein JWP65_1183 [Ramlibacter sp.]|uniref:DUF3426 domain-containing protein n=1 Tax=Ramlibacter sp. TaxID=1917967 RepID=UPI00260B7ED7|nr:DUF3426 domain-containing protein [Ramlibacter sp.]MDB5750762.1 hypothetical protein [Ramlibacter sp.]